MIGNGVIIFRKWLATGKRADKWKSAFAGGVGIFVVIGFSIREQEVGCTIYGFQQRKLPILSLE